MMSAHPDGANPAQSTSKQGGTMKRKASAEWRGDLKTGKGLVSTDSGALTGKPYSFTTRFENEKGTNPEELIAAAHAGCFTMALSGELGKAGLVPQELKTTATVSLDKLDAGWTVTESHLEVVGKIPGGSADAFRAAAEAAEKGCPISRLLNTKITMEAKLEG
jgi:osmotically inducible protein OsmC